MITFQIPPLKSLLHFSGRQLSFLKRIIDYFKKDIDELIGEFAQANQLIGFFSDFERMVSLKGMIIRCCSIIAEIREAIFRCLVCGFCTEPVAVERGRITEPTLFLREEYTGSQPMQVFG